MSDKIRDFNSHAANMFTNKSSLLIKIHPTFVEMSSIELAGKWYISVCDRRFVNQRLLYGDSKSGCGVLWTSDRSPFHQNFTFYPRAAQAFWLIGAQQLSNFFVSSQQWQIKVIWHSKVAQSPFFPSRILGATPNRSRIIMAFLLVTSNYQKLRCLEARAHEKFIIPYRWQWLAEKCLAQFFVCVFTQVTNSKTLKRLASRH
jgi:hypothetical protein